MRGGFDDSFFNRRTILLRHGATENLVFENESFAAWQRLENYFAVSELSAAAGLFLVTALHLSALRDRLFVRNFRRMQHHFNAVTLLQFLNDSFDVDLARSGQQEFLRLRVASKAQRGILFQNFVNGDADLFFVLT